MYQAPKLLKTHYSFLLSFVGFGSDITMDITFCWCPDGSPPHIKQGLPLVQNDEYL